MTEPKLTEYEAHREGLERNLRNISRANPFNWRKIAKLKDQIKNHKKHFPHLYI